MSSSSPSSIMTTASASPAVREAVPMQTPREILIPAATPQLTSTIMTLSLEPRPTTLNTDGLYSSSTPLIGAGSTNRRKQSIELQSLPDDVLFRIFAALVQNNVISANIKCRLRHAEALAISNSHLYGVFLRFLRSYKLTPSVHYDTFDLTCSSSMGVDVTTFPKPMAIWLCLRSPGVVSADLGSRDCCSSYEFKILARSLLESAPRLRRLNLHDFSDIGSCAASLVANAPHLTRLLVFHPRDYFLTTVCNAVQPRLRVIEIWDVSPNYRSAVVTALHDLATRAHLVRVLVRFQVIVEVKDMMLEFEFHDESPTKNASPRASLENPVTPAKIAASSLRYAHIQCIRVHDLNWANGNHNCFLCKSTILSSSLDPVSDATDTNSRLTNHCRNIHERMMSDTGTYYSKGVDTSVPRAKVYGNFASQAGAVYGLRAIRSLVQKGVRFLFRAHGFTAEGLPSATTRELDLFNGMRVIRSELNQMLTPRFHGPIVCNWQHVKMVDASCIACEDGLLKLETEVLHGSTLQDQEDIDAVLNLMNIASRNPDQNLRKGHIDALGLLGLTRNIACSASSLKTVSISCTDGANFSSLCLHMVGILFRYAPQLSVLNIGIDVLVSAAQTEQLDKVFLATKTLRVLHITTTSLTTPVVSYLLAKHPNYCYKLRRLVEEFSQGEAELVSDDDANDVDCDGHDDDDQFYDDDDEDSSDDDSIYDECQEDGEDDVFKSESRRAWRSLSPLFFRYYPFIISAISRCCQRVEIVTLHDADPCAGIFIRVEDLTESMHELDLFQSMHPRTDMSSLKYMLNAWSKHSDVSERIAKRVAWAMMREDGREGPSQKKQRLDTAQNTLRI